MGFKSTCWTALIGAVAFSNLTTVLHAENPSDPVDLSTVTAAQMSVVPSTYVWRSVDNHAFHPGESLSFVIKWGVIPGGNAVLTLQDMAAINGRPAFHLVSEAHSSGIVDPIYRVQDRHDIWLDQAALVTVRYEKRIHEGKYQIEEKTVIDQPHYRYFMESYRFDQKAYDSHQGSIPPNALDVMGSLYYMRTMPLVVGNTYSIDVVSSDKVYPLLVKVKRRETITVPAGKFDCFLVEPKLRSTDVFVAKGKDLDVWLTADERHMPVRMRSEVFIGHVSAELVQFRSGHELPNPPPLAATK